MKTLKHFPLVYLFLLFPSFIFAQECDTIVLLSGNEVIVQDLEELKDRIQYSKCGQDQATTYSLKREKINFIKYAPISLNRSLVRDSSLVYEAWVYSDKYSQIAKGYLHELRDSSIVVSASDMLNLSKNKLSEIDIQNIHVLKLKDKEHLRRSLRIGGLSGLLVGGTLGAVYMVANKQIRGSRSSSQIKSNGPDFLPILTFGSIGTLGGLIVGRIAGDLSTSIPIHGKQDRYKREREKLKKRWL